MRYRPPELKTLFKSFKAGDLDAMDQILASERERLFDYLMRMTGQISKSILTTDEAIRAVTPVLDREEDLQEVLVMVYKTARNFTIEIWNADTSRLENLAYQSPQNKRGDKQYPLLVQLESIIRSLPPKQREILLLHEKYGFSPDEIGEITGFGSSDIEEIFAHALGVTEAALPGEAEKVPELMTKLFLHPLIDETAVETQNLSSVIKDLKRSGRSTPGGVFKLVFGFVIIAAVAFAIWKHEFILKLLK